MSAEPERQGVEAIDHVYTALRTGALLVGVAYAYLGTGQGAPRDSVLTGFGVFAAYGMLAYVLGFRMLASGRQHLFYGLLGAADLAFVLYLMHLTGGVHSPFYRALYLWVAMPAFRYGLRTGTLASAVAFVAFVWFFASSEHDPWTLLVTSGGMLLHGPMIGYLIDRDRALVRRLRQAEAPAPTARTVAGLASGSGQAAPG